MTPEPLKGKLHEHSSKRLDHSDGSSSYITDKKCAIEEDIKSAVSGCLEEVTNSVRNRWVSDNDLREIFKKWFEDVM